MNDDRPAMIGEVREIVQASEHRLTEKMLDLQTQTEHRLTEKMRGMQTETEHRLIEKMLDMQTQIENRLVEVMRDMQTELLRGFAGFSDGYTIRLRKIEVDQSNMDAALSGRVSVLEKRLHEIELRLGGLSK